MLLGTLMLLSLSLSMLLLRSDKGFGNTVVIHTFVGKMLLERSHREERQTEAGRVGGAEAMSSRSSLRSISFFVSTGIRKRRENIHGREWICGVIDGRNRG